jgi:hypothetical protein
MLLPSPIERRAMRPAPLAWAGVFAAAAAPLALLAILDSPVPVWGVLPALLAAFVAAGLGLKLLHEATQASTGARVAGWLAVASGCLVWVTATLYAILL